MFVIDEPSPGQIARFRRDGFLVVERIIAPEAIAEWLATGVGLGNLLNQSRGYLDYGMIRAVAVVSVILSILFHQAVTVVERRVLARAGMWG